MVQGMAAGHAYFYLEDVYPRLTVRIRQMLYWAGLVFISHKVFMNL